MTDHLQKNNVISAKLRGFEDNLAYFVLNNDNNEIITWPLDKIPEGIEIGDEVNLSIDFELQEERREQLKKKAANESKYTEMRKLLEELVN